MNNKILIILGMHRSGTSLITQWLYKCGLQIGDELGGPGIGNADGHFEDYDFVILHECALRHNNILSNGLMPESVTELNKYYTEKFRITIELKNRLYGQWGWKDPRTCLFLSVYRKLFPGLKYLIITRDYNSIVNSLINRDFANIEKSYLKKAGMFKKLLWKFRRKGKLIFYYKELADVYMQVCLKYNEELLAHIQKSSKDDYMVVNYKMLLNNSKEVFRYITVNWCFKLEYCDFNSIYKPSLISKKTDISEFISDRSLIQKAVESETALKKYEFKLSATESKVS